MSEIQKPNMESAPYTYGDGAMGGANVCTGLTNIAKAIMYAADKYADSRQVEFVETGGKPEWVK